MSANFGSSSDGEVELNITPIIDCFTVLITFLLASASFISIGFFDAYTPGNSADPGQSEPDTEAIIKIKANDFQGQVGAGIEFFAPYFKLGFEIKYSQGFSNSFIQDGTPSSKPIDQLFNKVWWFSLIFEG